MPPPNHLEDPAHILLLRSILSEMSEIARVLDLLNTRMGGVEREAWRASQSVRDDVEKALAELRPAIEAYQREIEAREKAVVDKRAEAEADRVVASATWWRVAKVLGPLVLAAASAAAGARYAPAVSAATTPAALESAP